MMGKLFSRETWKNWRHKHSLNRARKEIDYSSKMGTYLLNLIQELLNWCEWVSFKYKNYNNHCWNKIEIKYKKEGGSLI